MYCLDKKLFKTVDRSDQPDKSGGYVPMADDASMPEVPQPQDAGNDEQPGQDGARSRGWIDRIAHAKVRMEAWSNAGNAGNARNARNARLATYSTTG